MPERPSFSRIDLWARREAEVRSVTRTALKALAASPPPESDEDSLNASLAEHIRHAVAAGRRAGELSIDLPALEPKSMPARALVDGPVERERKRPDLIWAWCDDQAPLDARPFLEMVIECKRIGDGDLCRLYVAKGVVRFQNDEHAYAKHMRSGFMVGYLQNISAAVAEQKIGTVLAEKSLAPLIDPAHPEATFGQDLRRPYPVDPFMLHHLWQAVPAAPSAA